MRILTKFVGILLIIVLTFGACTSSSTTLITTTATATITTTATATITTPTTATITTTLTTTTTTTVPASTGNDKVRILSHRMGLTETGLPMVTGTVENTTSIFLRIIEVWVHFLDASGRLLGTYADFTHNDLGPGERWSFLNIYFGPNPEDVKSYIVEIGTPN